MHRKFPKMFSYIKIRYNMPLKWNFFCTPKFIANLYFRGFLLNYRNLPLPYRTIPKPYRTRPYSTVPYPNLYETVTLRRKILLFLHLFPRTFLRIRSESYRFRTVPIPNCTDSEPNRSVPYLTAPYRTRPLLSKLHLLYI